MGIEVASVYVLNHPAIHFYKTSLQYYDSEFLGLQKVGLR